MRQEARKARILYLLEILRKETDEEHGLTMPEIIQKLEEDGIQAERKAIYKDIEALRDFGYEVTKTYENPVRYRLISRDFSENDLLLLIDAVRSSKFLTKRKSESLVRSIKLLGSRYQAQDVGRSVSVSGRVKSQNKSAFQNVNAIQKAFSLKRKIEFRYFDYDSFKKRRFRKSGGFYSETPVQLFYSEGNYYLLAFNDKHESMVMFRVDRMDSVRVSGEKATRNEIIATFDADDFIQRIFGMYQGDPQSVRMVADPSLVNNVIDTFGEDVFLVEENGKVSFSVKVMESDTFFGWVAQFRGRIEIKHPSTTVEAYRKFIEDLSKTV